MNFSLLLLPLQKVFIGADRAIKTFQSFRASGIDRTKQSFNKLTSQ